MTPPTFLGTNLFQEASTPLEVFPSGSWVRATTKVPLHMDICGRFGSCPIPGDATACVAVQTQIREDFQQINQDRLLQLCPDDIILPNTPHHFLLCTLAKKYQVLMGANSAVGTLARSCLTSLTMVFGHVDLSWSWTIPPTSSHQTSFSTLSGCQPHLHPP